MNDKQQRIDAAKGFLGSEALILPVGWAVMLGILGAVTGPEAYDHAWALNTHQALKFAGVGLLFGLFVVMILAWTLRYGKEL